MENPMEQEHRADVATIDRFVKRGGAAINLPST
jgi:hypothetical protein